MNSTLYYTNTAAGLSTTGPAEAVKILNGGGCSSLSYLNSPLVIGASNITVNPDLVSEATSTDENGVETAVTPTEGKFKGTLDLRLYFDLENAAYASDGSSNSAAYAPSGKDCFGSTVSAPSICANFPKIIGTLDSTTPTIVRMQMNTHTLFGFYFGGSEIPFGAYQRVYFI
jgi:hypothetical protein